MFVVHSVFINTSVHYETVLYKYVSWRKATKNNGKVPFN